MTESGSFKLRPSIRFTFMFIFKLKDTEDLLSMKAAMPEQTMYIPVRIHVSNLIRLCIFSFKIRSFERGKKGKNLDEKKSDRRNI